MPTDASGSAGATAPAEPGPATLPSRRFALDDLLSGVIFVAFGAAFAGISATYEIGTLLRMGPGYFPLVLGVILIAFGVAIILTTVLVSRRGDAAEQADDADKGGIPWIRGGLVLLAIVLFGVLITLLGLVPALLVTTFLAALAGHGTKPVSAAVIAVGLTLLCILVFVVALQLKLPLFITPGG